MGFARTQKEEKSALSIERVRKGESERKHGVFSIFISSPSRINTLNKRKTANFRLEFICCVGILFYSFIPCSIPKDVECEMIAIWFRIDENMCLLAGEIIICVALMPDYAVYVIL